MAGSRELRVVIVGDSRDGQRAFRDLDAAGGASESRLSQVGSKMDAVGDRMQSVGKKMTTYVSLPLAGIGVVAVKTAADFEVTMNTMAAVAEVPGPEMEKLSALAIKMGADTVFSAGEAADAMLELAKAGVSTADITGGALAASLNLAAVEGMALADASTVVANALNVFKLRGDQANIVTDALAGASKASSASVQDMAYAFQMGGSAAAASGLSVQEFSAYLAAMANAGIKGSDAGTSVKSMLLNLQPTTKKAATAMRELGLNFVDSKGNFLDMRDIAGQLHDKLGKLPEAQRLMALEVIFGSDAMRAANVLTNEGAAGFDKLMASTTKAGTAQELADARMKGTAGSLERMKGSLETAALKFGQALAPAVEKVAGWIEKLANWFTNLSPKTQETIMKVALLVAALGPVIVIVGMVVSAIGTLIPVIVAVGGFLIGLGGPVLLVIAALVLLYAKCEWFRDVVNAVFSHIWNIIKGAFDIIMGVWKIFSGILSGDWSRVWEGIKQVLHGAWEVIKNQISMALGLVWNILVGVLWKIPGLFADAWMGALDAVRGAVGNIFEFVRGIPGRILDAVGNLNGLLVDAGKSVIQGLWNGLQSMGGWLKDRLIELIKNTIPGPIRDILKIGSPSKVTFGLGADTGEGLGLGILSTARYVEGAMTSVADKVASVPLSAGDISGATGRLGPFVPAGAGTTTAGGTTAAGGRQAPAVHIENWNVHEEADADVIMRRVEFAADAAGL